MVDENFEEYFLNAQRENNEVYIGEGIALVVYPEEQVITIQCDVGYFLWDFGPVSCSITDFAGSNLEKELLEIRKPENLTGIREDLTSQIRGLYSAIVNFVEAQEASAIELYREGLGYNPFNNSQLTFEFY